MLSNDSLIKMGELLGIEEDRLKKIAKIDFSSQYDKLELDLTTGSIEHRHSKLLDACRDTLISFENCDEVECNIDLINPSMINTMWQNINVYSYDIEKFFVEKCVLRLYSNNGDRINLYFSIEDGNVFLYILDKNNKEMIGGTIVVKDGMFYPYGALNEDYYEIFRRQMLQEGKIKNRQALGDEIILSNLLYFLIINQMIINNKEIITETSKRVEVGKKKKSRKNKTKTKKTKVVRYIKVDEIKVRKIREEHERVSRGSYERHISEWTKRGHWRKLASGDKIWIKPTVARAQNKEVKKLQKIYKIQ